MASATDPAGSAAGDTEAIEVCAAVVVRDSYVLLAQRPEGRHLAGKWEFPGGKVHNGEDHDTCIRRELAEELGLESGRTEHLTSITHHYPEKTVRLHFRRCHVSPAAVPIHHEGQQSVWISFDDLAIVDLAPADRLFAEWLIRHPVL